MVLAIVNEQLDELDAKWAHRFRQEEAAE